MTAVDLGLARRPQALLLDAGDTLIFFDAAAVSEVLRAEGVELDAAKLQAAIHPAKRRYQGRLTRGCSHIDGLALLLIDLLGLAGLDMDRARAVLPAVVQAHRQFNFWRKVPSELPDALARARKAGIRLAVIANAEGALHAVLERVGLAQYFDLVLDAAAEGAHRPEPEIFRRALKRLDVRGDYAVYAGDIPELDMVGAARAGVRGILVDGEGHYSDQRRYPCTKSVVELIDAVVGLPRSLEV